MAKFNINTEFKEQLVFSFINDLDVYLKATYDTTYVIKDDNDNILKTGEITDINELYEEFEDQEIKKHFYVLPKNDDNIITYLYSSTYNNMIITDVYSNDYVNFITIYIGNSVGKTVNFVGDFSNLTYFSLTNIYIENLDFLNNNTILETLTITYYEESEDNIESSLFVITNKELSYINLNNQTSNFTFYIDKPEFLYEFSSLQLINIETTNSDKELLFDKNVEGKIFLMDLLDIKINIFNDLSSEFSLEGLYINNCDTFLNNVQELLDISPNLKDFSLLDVSIADTSLEFYNKFETLSLDNVNSIRDITIKNNSNLYILTLRQLNDINLYIDIDSLEGLNSISLNNVWFNNIDVLNLSNSSILRGVYFYDNIKIYYLNNGNNDNASIVDYVSDRLFIVDDINSEFANEISEYNTVTDNPYDNSILPQKRQAISLAYTEDIPITECNPTETYYIEGGYEFKDVLYCFTQETGDESTIASDGFYCDGIGYREFENGRFKSGYYYIDNID